MTMITIPEPIAFRFFKTRRKDVIATTLKTWTPKDGEPVNIVDVRLWPLDRYGCNVPSGKGVSMSVRRLPDLLKAVTAAHKKAQELGLLDGPAGDDEPPPSDDEAGRDD